MHWYIEVLKKYAVFGGRACRAEYWYFFLFNVIIGFVLGFIDGLTGSFSPEIGIGLFSGLYSLAVLIPGIAVSFRRLHDTGRSGWYLLLVLIPFVGPIVVLVFMATASEPVENKYGPVVVSAKPAPER